MSTPRWTVFSALLVGCTFSALVGENPRTPDAAVPPVDALVPPDVSAPDVSAPDVSAPDVSAPDVVTPEVTTPDAVAFDVSTPDVPAPFDAPDVATPDEAAVDGGRGDVPSGARDATAAPEVSLGDGAITEATTAGPADADEDEAALVLDAGRCVSDDDCAGLRPPSRCEAATGRCVPR